MLKSFYLTNLELDDWKPPNFDFLTKEITNKALDDVMCGMK